MAPYKGGCGSHPTTISALRGYFQDFDHGNGGRARKTIMTFHKNNMIDVSVREAFGGASFFIITGDGEIEAARFSLPYIEPFRQAIPAIRNWLAEGDETGGLTLPALEESTETYRCSKCDKTASPGTSKCLNCSSKWSLLRRLAAYCTPYRSPMLVSALLLVLSVFIEVIPPYLIKMIVDEVAKPSGSLNMLLPWQAVWPLYRCYLLRCKSSEATLAFE